MPHIQRPPANRRKLASLNIRTRSPETRQNDAAGRYYHPSHLPIRITHQNSLPQFQPTSTAPLRGPEGVLRSPPCLSVSLRGQKKGSSPRPSADDKVFFAVLRVSPCPSADKKKAVLRAPPRTIKCSSQFSASLRALRGQKKGSSPRPTADNKVFFAVLRVSPRPPRTKKGSSPPPTADNKVFFAVLRVSPCPSADKKKAVLRPPPRTIRCSSQFSASLRALRGQKKGSSPRPSADDKVFFAVLRVSPRPPRTKKRQFSAPHRGQ